MRNQRLQGYLIHARKYRERSYIIHFFSHEYGRVDGVVRQSIPPLFQPVILNASGRSDLKNFNQIEIQNQPVFLQGEAYFCGFYLNELLLKLSPLEEALPNIYLQYHKTIHELQYLADYRQDQVFLKQLLRQFEQVFLKELGYDIDFRLDYLGCPISEQKSYEFVFTQGFVETKKNNSFQGQDILSLSNLAQPTFNAIQLFILGRLYKITINHLLGDRPLKSRQLWLQYNQIQR